MKVIIVGAGGTTRALLRRLSAAWDVTVVDVDPQRLARAAQVRDITTVVGDGTSRVVLDRIPLPAANAVVAATNSDDVNLEVCRLATEAGITRLVATAASSERLAEYRNGNIPAYAPGRLAAFRLGLALDTGRVGSAVFADGKAEAIELLIGPDTPVIGKTLGEIHSERWLVAAILRDSRLIVPHGETRIECGDLVTVVGTAPDHALIVRTFSSTLSRFPADWGRLVAVAVQERTDLATSVPEAAGLVRNSAAESLLVIHQDPAQETDEDRLAELEDLMAGVREASAGVETRFRAVSGSPIRSLPQVCAAESVGLVVMPPPRGGALRRRFTAARSLQVASELQRPVLFGSGVTSYSQVVVALPEGGESGASVQAAVDLAAGGRIPVTGIAALPQARGAAAREAAQGAVTVLHEEGAALGVAVRHQVRRGAWSRLFAEEALQGGLAVLPMPSPSPSPFQLGAAGTVVANGPGSILLIPGAGSR